MGRILGSKGAVLDGRLGGGAGVDGVVEVDFPWGQSMEKREEKSCDSLRGRGVAY